MVLLIALMPVDDAQERLAVSEPTDVLDHEASDFLAYAIRIRRHVRVTVWHDRVDHGAGFFIW